MYKKNVEIKIFYVLIALLFTIFLFIPLVTLFINSFKDGQEVGIFNYISILKDKETFVSMINSIKVSGMTAIVSTIIAFILAYALNCTKICNSVKHIIQIGILAPMLLPTITYGFTIVYSFGKNGLLTNLFGKELFHIYGFNGLLIGYVIYTLPPTFLIINNSFKYIDKKFIVVSKLMGDGIIRSFKNTIIRPLLGTLGGAFVLSFILSFTDFGIPASVGGNYKVIAINLYEVMLGSIPDFGKGSVIAILMLMPTVLGILFLNYLEKFDFTYDKFTKTDLIKNPLRDIVLAILSIFIMISVLSIFVIMFIAPFVKNFPYDMTFTSKIFKETLFSRSTLIVYKNSIIISIITAIVGTVVCYAAAIINVRTQINKSAKMIIDIFSMITNTIPGMVLGLSYLLFFNKSSLKGTFIIIIICNTIHFFTTPYLMAKNSFFKMNPAWETTGELLGDTWIKTIVRVIIPSSMSTIIEMFSYYFINAMVTISAVIFIVTARTSVITSKIKELQHYGNFNEIFILSILIFVTNIVVKICCNFINNKVYSESK